MIEWLRAAPRETGW